MFVVFSLAMKNWPTLDLHGKKTDEVPDLVDRFLMKHQNEPKVRIMTGKGTGAVRQTVIDYLELGGFPWKYERGSKGDENAGVLIVSLNE